MKIQVKEINLKEVDPATTGALANQRACEINDQIKNFKQFFNINVGDVYDVQIRIGNHAKIGNLGIYSCPGKDAPPKRAGIMLDKNGCVYVDINYHTTQVSNS